jgi:hypothetical protein
MLVFEVAKIGDYGHERGIYGSVFKNKAGRRDN